MTDLEPPKKRAAPGAPMWLATFADLMSLLMCFFVLILSFSEMDVLMWKRIAGSMANAFGSHREDANPIPMGTSFVKNTFSPGEPDPTVVQTQFQTVDHFQELKIGQTPMLALAESVTAKLRDGLKERRKARQVAVDRQGSTVIVRIQEQGAFPSGSADILGSGETLFQEVATQIADIPGRILVTGHTDDVPIATSRYRSNWELSTARAVTVVQELLKDSTLDPHRVLVRGHADTLPLAPNDTPENRALNRRVEIRLELE